MDKKAISVENLTDLFVLLSRKFPSPKNLTIYVETNAKQIPGPGECERSGESEVQDTENYDDYPYVRFYRLNANEFFRIMEYGSVRTVVIKGKDPFAGQINLYLIIQVSQKRPFLTLSESVPKTFLFEIVLFPQKTIRIQIYNLDQILYVYTTVQYVYVE